jgi:hypothetical protein
LLCLLSKMQPRNTDRLTQRWYWNDTL